MQTILKLALFGLSSLGSWEFIRRNSKIDILFLPGLTIAIQTTFLFCAGLLNLLPETAHILYLTGFAGLLYAICKDRSIRFIKQYFCAGYFFMAAALLISMVYLRGKLFTHYDNFSHWALVVRSLIETDRFPNFMDTLITFQSYPLGSAAYIYYFFKFMVPSEAMQMLAQAFVMIASMMPLFLFGQKKPKTAFLLISAATVFIFTYNILPHDLLVDTLLPLVAMSGLLYAVFYCKQVNSSFEHFSVSFYLVQLIQIKNSGIFFVGLICAILLYYMFINKKYVAFIPIATPFFSLLLWQKHCKYVFHSAATSKHAMTAENYLSTFGSKTLENINTIVSKFLAFLLEYKDHWIFFALIVVLMLLCFLLDKTLRKKHVKILFLCMILFVVYQAGMLAMYLFSMPTSEALNLGSMERYTKTILTAILYLCTIYALNLISSIEGKNGWSAFILAMFAAVFILSSHGSSYSNSKRLWLEDAKTKYNIREGKTYAILLPQNDGWYTYYLGKYIFKSHIDISVIASAEQMNNLNARYILIMDQENPIIDNWIAENYPEQYGNEVIIR